MKKYNNKTKLYECVCDRCLERVSYQIAIVFKKYDGSNRLGREMIKCEMILCENCITELMKEFGRLKNVFLKEGE